MGQGCSAYNDGAPCGAYDNLGFVASAYCCACGGGATSTVTDNSWGYLADQTSGGSTTTTTNQYYTGLIVPDEEPTQEYYTGLIVPEDEPTRYYTGLIVPEEESRTTYTQTTTTSSWDDYDHDHHGHHHQVNLFSCPPEVCPMLYPDVECFDSNAIYRDTGDDSCEWYGQGTNRLSCGAYDTVDFKAGEMCCACGGGSPEPVIYDVSCENQDFEARDNGNDGCNWYGRRNRNDKCGDYDDADFSAGEMCCVCGGGKNVAIF